MTNPNVPPRQPPHNPPPRPVDYATPRPSPNAPGVFFLRMVVGVVAGLIALGLGGLLAYIDLNPPYKGNVAIPLFFLPFVALIIAAGVYTLTKRRFGYVTGILSSVGLIVVGAFALLLAICGGAIR